MNGIIANLFRGVYDYKVTAFKNDKNYQCVAVDCNNWIADNDKTLKKRPAFKFLYEISEDSWVIPFDYDDNQHYLMRFFTDPEPESGESENKCEFYQYINGNLILAEIAQEPFVKPTYTTNSAPQDDISDIKSAATAFWHFNSYAGSSAQKNAMLTSGYEVESGRIVDYWCQISFDTPVNISSINYIYGHRWGFYASTSVIAASYWQNIEVQGSQDGINWTYLKNFFNTEPVMSYASYYSKSNQEILTDTYWKYYRFYVRDFKKTSTNTAPDGQAAMFGITGISGVMPAGATPIESSITAAQAKTASYSQTFRKILFAGADFLPQQFTTSFSNFTATGLDFNVLGNPVLVKLYQERVLFAGYTNLQRQFNLSKAGDINTFTLNTTDVKSTDPIQGTMQEQVYKPSWAFGGRNILYIGSNDGLFNIQGGAGQPITATFIDAHLRMVKPCADIPIVKNEDIGYFVSSDKQTIYAFDFDYSVDRMKAVEINNHCLNKFDSGIKMMVIVKGKTDYLQVLLNNGTMMSCLISKFNEFSNASGSLQNESLHAWFPINTSGEIKEIMVLQNNISGEDTLFAIIKLLNDAYTIQELEKFNYTNIDYDWEDKIDGAGESSTETLSLTVSIDGTRDPENKYKITGGSSEWIGAYKVILEDSVGKTIILTNLNYEDGFWWANTNSFPNPDLTYIKSINSFFSWNNEVVDKLLSFQSDNILLDNKTKISQTNPSGYLISIDGTINVNNKYKISITGDVSWDDAYQIVISGNGIDNVLLSDLEFDSVNWYANLDRIPNPTDVFTSYIKYKNIFEVPNALLGLELQAYENGKLFETTWNTDLNTGEFTTINTPIGMIEPIFGTKYLATVKYANLADIKSIGKKLQVNQIGVNSSVSWGLSVGTAESEMSDVQTYGGISGYMQNTLLPNPSYDELVITDNSKTKKYIVLNQELPYYSEVEFLMYDLKIGG